MNAPLLALALAAFFPPQEEAPARKLAVVASHPALMSIAAQVGGERVTVTSIIEPSFDVHDAQATPSVFAQLRDADVFVHTGLDLELWADDAVKGSRNPRIRAGQPGNIDASEGVKLLDVPENPSRAAGDVHIYGNPHYWLDPLNALTIAQNVAAGLAALDPGSARVYLDNRKAFEEDVKQRLAGWLKRTIPRKNTPLVVYHDSFPYFTRRFGFRVVATVEPKPRVTPTQAHLLEVIQAIHASEVKVVLREPFHDEDATNFLADKTGAKVVTVSTMPGVRSAEETYQDLIEHNLDAILGALP